MSWIFYPYSLQTTFDIKLYPSDPISIFGFPFGKTSHGRLAIWSTGFVATDIDIDYQNLPVFLVYCRSREGQSGSPVIAQRNGGSYIAEDGSTKMAVGFHWDLQRKDKSGIRFRICLEASSN